ncbi:MAG: HU family DNA-binding protein [Acidobacteriota bacterium]
MSSGSSPKRAREHHGRLSVGRARARHHEGDARPRRAHQLRGFGVFKVTKKKTGLGRNPKTGEEVRITSGKTVKFKPGKELREPRARRGQERPGNRVCHMAPCLRRERRRPRSTVEIVGIFPEQERPSLRP